MARNTDISPLYFYFQFRLSVNTYLSRKIRVDKGIIKVPNEKLLCVHGKVVFLCGEQSK